MLTVAVGAGWVDEPRKTTKMRIPNENPLLTRADLQAAFLELEGPVLAAWNNDESGPLLNLYRARYPAIVSRLETVGRYLWGLVPFSLGGGISQGWPHVLDAIVHGTDPAHPEYWGPAGERDQRSVEMASFGVALRTAPQFIWDPLSAAQKDRFATWLGGMVSQKLVTNNWQFFRLLVTLGLRHIDRAPPDTDRFEQQAIDIIDGCYLGDGWYTDGDTDQRDYYVAMAFHFYGLLCGHLAQAGPVLHRIDEWKSRAEQFSRDFVYWFAAGGPAIPFGRSLTYRFAQAAFWGGSALVALPGFSQGELKGLLLRNLRWWRRQPILYPDGVLSLGYAYPNLNMLEPYNASGSPYWAQKAFTVLQLPPDHPFWTAPEEALPKMPARSVQIHPRFVIERDEGSGHVTAVSAGQWYTWALRHRDAKFAKFAYSTFFGPCVGPNHEWLEGVGLDNTLSIVAADTIPSDGALWQNHGLSANHRIFADHLYSEWKSIPGIFVQTWLVPLGAAWHVRIHRISTDRVIQLAEGAFASPDPRVESSTVTGICLRGSDDGITGLLDLTGDRQPAALDVEPDSSLYHSKVSVPYLSGRFSPGVHWLGAAVFGAAPGSNASWDTPPQIGFIPEKRLTIVTANLALVINFNSDTKAPTQTVP